MKRSKIPASELWLYKNPEALASVLRGLQECAEGKAAFVGSFAEHAEPEDTPETQKTGDLAGLPEA